MSEHSIPLAITMGEPAGIGPDLILRLYADRASLDLPPFIVYGNLSFLEARARRLGLDIALAAVRPTEAASTFASAMPVAQVEGLVPDRPGETRQVSSKVVIEAITRATTDVTRGACRGLVTAPIHKAALYAAGFHHPGHTEFLASLCASNGVAPTPVMMLVHEGLRAVPATIHMPLQDVPRAITAELLLKTGRIVAHSLRTRFGIEEPKLAFCGLNPHAGEGGTIGMEDLDVIAPAVAQLRHEGLDVTGPLAGDTAFYPPLWRRFDAVVAMYHDQALIPIKALAFESAVNVTLGLPIVRTSPDHGTAFDLAGTNESSTASMLAAIRLAHTLTSRQPAAAAPR